MAARYVVAATPRTGSTLLCEALADTGVAGVPDEPFAPHLRAGFCRALGLPPGTSGRRYVAAALRLAATPNRACAFKIHGEHVPALAAELGCAPDEVLERVLPGATYVRTVRRDRRAQALSWFRALHTDEWARYDDRAPAPPPALDVAEVRSLERWIEHDEREWARRLAGARVVTVVYEDLVADRRAEVARVLAHLGLDPAAADALPPARLRRQAGAETADWRRRMEAARA